jgi:hypothetical protein
MITRLGDTSLAPYQSNAGLAWDSFTTWLADLGSSAKYGTIPNATTIVPSQASPSTIEQGTTAGAWTPLDSASQGLADSQANQTALISNAISSGSYDPNGNYLASSLGVSGIPWGTIAIIGACVLGVVVIVPMLGRK